MARATRIFGVLLSFALIPPAALGADEAEKAPRADGPVMFRADAARTGHYPGALGKAAPGQKHTRIVYASSTDGHVYAWDAMTGDAIWNYDLHCKVLSCPAVARGVVYVGTCSRYEGRRAKARDGSPDSVTPCVAALDALTGAVRWKVDPGRPVTSSLVPAEGTVCLGTDDGYLYALNAEDGRRRWETKIADRPLEHCPAAANGVFYSGVKNLCALSAKTGEILWSTGLDHPTRGGEYNISAITFAPAAVEGMVYVTTSGTLLGGTTRYNEVVALEAKTGRQVWAKRGAGASAAAAVAGGIVYVPSYDDWLYALSAASGQELWKARLDRPDIVLGGGGRMLLVADGAVYVQCALGLLKLEARTGRELSWSVRPPRELEVFSLVDGILYGGACQINWPLDGVPTSASRPFLAFDPADGKTLWRVTDKGGFASGCAVAEGMP